MTNNIEYLASKLAENLLAHLDSGEWKGGNLSASVTVIDDDTQLIITAGMTLVFEDAANNDN